jgi:hypothetical protein
VGTGAPPAHGGPRGPQLKLVLELMGITAGGRVVSLATDRAQAAGEKPKAGKKIVGGAALGAGTSLTFRTSQATVFNKSVNIASGQ